MGSSDQTARRPEHSAIVLAGGRSTRLGRDKASEPLLGRTLLQRVVDRVAAVAGEVVVVRARGQRLPQIETSARLSILEDVYPDAGPLGGLYTGLQAVSSPAALAVACDMPLLQPALLEELLRLAPGSEAVAPLDAGLPQPLCAVYSRACLPAIARLLEAGNFRLTDLFGQVEARYLSPEEWRRFDPGGVSFLNLNREQDLARATDLLQAERASA